MAVKSVLYPEIRSRNGPAFYATPVAWAAADFTRSLIEEEGAIQPSRTALIVASDECSLATIRELSRSAERGTISPLRFAGSSPSIVAGLPALEQGIRGPTLCLTMPPEKASGPILALIDFWLADSDVVSVIAIAHYPAGDGGHLFKGLIARASGDETECRVRRLCDPRPD